MRILISSHAFAPSIGGLETVSRLLANEFSASGHEVVVVTRTSAANGEKFPFRVVRRPSIPNLFGLMQWCDVYWQNNLSVRTIWPAFILRKPIVITHQGSYAMGLRGLDLALRVKHWIVNHTTSVAISEAVASCFATNSTVIPNPYDARVFTRRASSAQRDDLIFVGRLVSEKGVDLLLEALAQLRERQLYPRLTIAGAGPEQARLQNRSRELGLENQVQFVGAKAPEELAELLNRHRVLVVPSRYDEPFGVVALEGIACGCAVLGSHGGGLPEAIGPCGITFPNCDVATLTDSLAKLLTQPDESERFQTNAARHLARFHPATVAQQYQDIFRSKLAS
jgi:glycogen synthase